MIFLYNCNAVLLFFNIYFDRRHFLSHGEFLSINVVCCVGSVEIQIEI